MEIILAQGKQPLARAIQQAVGYKYSHAALRYTHSQWMIHSSIGGVQPEWWYHFQKRYGNIRRYNCLFDCADKAAENLVKQIGHKQYAYTTLIGSGLVLAFDTLGIHIKNPFKSNNAFFCTKVILHFFKKCNELDSSLKLKEYISEALTPKDIGEYLDENPNFVLINPSV